MRDEAAFPREHLLQLRQLVLAAERQLDQPADGETPGPLRREGAVAVERVVHVDHAPLFMGAHGNATAHVRHDEVALRVRFLQLRGGSSGYRLLIERVEDGAALDLRKSGVACKRTHFVHDDRVDDVRLPASALVGQTNSQRSAQVARVRAPRTGAQVFEHLIAHFVRAALDRLEKSSPPHYRVEVRDRCAVRGKALADLFKAEFLLLHDAGETADHVRIVALRFAPKFGMVLEESDLGAGGAGIESEDFHNDERSTY